MRLPPEGVGLCVFSFIQTKMRRLSTSLQGDLVGKDLVCKYVKIAG